MDHHHYESPMISPTAHHALRTVISGSVKIFHLFTTEIVVWERCGVEDINVNLKPHRAHQNVVL